MQYGFDCYWPIGWWVDGILLVNWDLGGNGSGALVGSRFHPMGGRRVLGTCYYYGYDHSMWLEGEESSVSTSSSTYMIVDVDTPLMENRDEIKQVTPTVRNEDAANDNRWSRSESSLNLFAFFLFGLVNNVVYAIFLSSADDLLRNEPNIRKSSVLLANIIPCIVIKLVSPHFVRIIPYRVMITTTVVCSLLALFMVALFEPMWLKFLGIVLASAGSGVGETSCLALTTYYNPSVVIAWSSGTGAAGIVGSVFYLALTTWMGLTLSTTLLIAGSLPLVMAAAYFLVLQPAEQHVSVAPTIGHEGATSSSSSPHHDANDANNGPDQESDLKKNNQHRLSTGMNITSLEARLQMIRPLIIRYILPLFLVYYAEYVINNSVFFSLYYPLEKTPFHEYRQHYPTYQAIYQTGVFLSRTFGRVLPVPNSWIFAILQCGMLVLLSLETMWGFIGNIYWVFILICFEGLLGGSAYINTFCNITYQVPKDQVEFSMAFTGIADSTGIGLAGLTCLTYEPYLCRHNPLCQLNRPLPPP